MNFIQVQPEITLLNWEFQLFFLKAVIFKMIIKEQQPGNITLWLYMKV